MRWIFHGHELLFSLSSGSRCNQRLSRHHRSGKSPASWPNGNGPKTFHPAFERMQPEPRQIHVNNRGSSMKRCQNIPQLGSMFRVDAAGVVVFKKPFQPSMADTFYHPVPYPATWHMSRTIIATLQHVKCGGDKDMKEKVGLFSAG
jgi:hypothetical protein